MKSSIIEKAKKIISERNFQAFKTASEIKEEALHDEEFKKLYTAYVDEMIQNAKSNIDNDDNLKILQSKYLKRLKELGLPSIEPQFFCKKCSDTGVIGGKYCSCLIDEVNRILKQESGFINLEDFKDANFEQFKNKELVESIYDKMKKWCHNPKDKTIIYIAGPVGVGKTHLIKCMANELINLHKVVLLTTSFALHQDFLKHFACKDEEQQLFILNKYLEAEILFIDDLGTELRHPNITLNYLYQIINERKMNKLPTIITSNLDFEDLMEYYDERVSSRIADKSTSICIYIDDDDMRIKLKK